MQKLLCTFSREAKDLDTPGWLMLRAEPAARQLPDLATRLNTTSWDSVKGTWVEASSTYCLGPLPLCSAGSPACDLQLERDQRRVLRLPAGHEGAGVMGLKPDVDEAAAGVEPAGMQQGVQRPAGL